MSKMKTGLGRGLGALINPNFDKETLTEKVTVSEAEIKRDDGESNDVLAKIPINNIVPNPYQPRTNFEPGALDELKNSILENGLIQPITIRRVDKHFELISGERRLRASKELGLKDIPAYVIKVDTKEAMLALSLIENIQREDLNPIEIATTYRKLMVECDLPQEEIAIKVGKERSTITNSMRLLKLPNRIQQALISGTISAGHARAILGLTDERSQLAIFDRIIKEKLSVRNVEKLVKEDSPKAQIKKGQKDKSSLDYISNASIESKLRGIFGTKVICKQKKDGAGSVSIDFYSEDELERLLELFDTIEN
ncbi:MAG: ParB/RepB/Spo0J family partition protein [Melioribacteraceae bacterium]|jgi:ParB family chromosome partitioning protein|nr:ParB/RepB/Spo0J family partition protein [Melioribacteraceae bacterium]